MNKGFKKTALSAVGIITIVIMLCINAMAVEETATGTTTATTGTTTTTAGTTTATAGTTTATTGTSMTASISTVAEETLEPGDLNGDGKISGKDIRILEKYLDGTSELNDNQKIAADVNKDGTIDKLDIELLKEEVSGMIS